MRYLSFTIQNYRAINGPLVVDISKRTLLPIIGINECGKTTVLNAIFAFDEINDTWNKGRYLKNFHNLYSTERPNAVISASIEVSPEELLKAIKDVEKDAEVPSTGKKGISAAKREAKNFQGPLVVERNLETKKYGIENELFRNREEVASHVATIIVRRCPYLLYFDDFTESVDDTVEIKKDEGGALSPWLSILEQLFKSTNQSYSVFKLKEMEDLHRKSVISDVTKRLNDTLADEWAKFSLEGGSVLRVVIDYKDNGDGGALSLQIKEDIEGNERFFGIRDRSKGFFWFFNFLMKLEFNPKVRNLGDRDTIYLLDEPGSYLHANAQSKLCEKLSALSQNNVVIYCTHSHYLLNPEYVPINSVQVVEKDGQGAITMKPIASASGHIKERRGTFQPLLDALQVKPLIFDYSVQDLVLVEGIYDYYVFELFKHIGGKSTSDVRFFPGVDADSILYNTSFAIFGGVRYVALWDNDEKGRQVFGKAKQYFGEAEAEKFLLLPSLTQRSKYRLEELFDPKDLKRIKKSLGIPENTSFEKTILTLRFASNKDEVVKVVSEASKKRIRHVLAAIEEKLKQQKSA